ncbi:MetQ/NlpA family ABC transporter substrate-binding protein [Pseudoleptotrichia goodfellowii]|uniref:Lipoprotein n=1 Tax=Pseudoleptotrichia goodfellowii TaxID=157692 RepID=A0A510JAD2_9FUSO|nr:MetQ/NlpA family ABC transporter substrate-binding protein [Pseudoleptotrichia goodfellowii]MBF4806487.1 MetQ/NlpA family ABC transporter substrate-binding protein [Pseudoleptotrichia goodfellowii]BBM36270.1 NLPA lipoprotein [Pseudoleptotrichia goodfellowii]
MKKLLLLGVLTLLFVLSCGGKKEETKDQKGSAEEPKKTEKLVVGATPVPHQELLELVKDDLKNEGIDLEIVQFNDYVQPNKGLADKSLDANFFQHIPYMEEFAKKNNMELVSVGKIHLEPMAIYSKKIKNINDLKEGDTILIPNDPTNGGRALILLDKAGVLKLKDNTKLDSTVADIVENNKKIKIEQLAPEQLAPRLSEVTAAIINSNFALDAKLSFKDDTIFIEDKDSPYVNIVTVLKGRENEEKIQKLVKALQSEKVKKYLEEKYSGSVIPSF